MIGIWETIKVCILGAILIGTMAATWAVQNWRWESKETAYLQQEQKLIQAEAAKQAKAAGEFEKKEQKSDETYKRIIEALKKAKPDPTVCFDPDRMRGVNAALAREAPNTGGPSGSVPGPDAAQR